MFVYLTGTINGIRDMEKFKEIEKELWTKHKYRVLNLIDIKTIDDNEYNKLRMKAVIKVDLVIFIGNHDSKINSMEYDLASFLHIPIEVYNDIINSNAI